jgi:hypothetical protein
MQSDKYVIMKSFKDYLKYRNGLPLSEMAADPVKFTDAQGREREEVEVKRTPIFLDQDDIDYLNYFPMKFWKQALQKRYGEFLHGVYLNREKEGAKFEDVRKVPIKTSGGRTYNFLNVDTKANELYDKLNADPGTEIYQNMRVRKGTTGSEKEEFERRASELSKKKEKRIGSYGYNFLDYIRSVDKKTGKTKGVARGYVEPGEREILAALSRTFGSMQSGWFDKHLPADHRKESVSWGSNKSKTIPVENEKRKWIEGKDFVISGKSSRKKGEETIESWHPLMTPGFMIPNNAYRKHEDLTKTSSHIRDHVSSTSFLSDYLKILNIDGDLIEKEGFVNKEKYEEIIKKRNNLLSEIEALESKMKLKGFEDFDDGDEKVTKSKDGKLLISKKEEYYKINKLVRLGMLLGRPGPKTKLEKYIREEIEKLDPSASESIKQQSIKSAFRRFLLEVADALDRSARRLREKTPRYDLHQYNTFQNSMHHTNERPHSRLRGIGTFQPNKQQPERGYAVLADVLENDENIKRFWNHLFQDAKILENIELGIKSRVDTSQPEKDLSSIFHNSLKEAILETRNLSEITNNASVQFQNKSDFIAITHYARAFRSQVINKNISIEEFLRKKNISKLLSRVKSRATREASDYCKQVIQLHTRFAKNRFNRTYRLENPWEPGGKGYTLAQIIQSFFQSTSEPIDVKSLTPMTSHAISHLQDLAKTPITPEEIKSAGSTTVNSTEKEKQMNQEIKSSLWTRMIDKVRRLGGSLFGRRAPQAQAPQAQAPQAQAGIGTGNSTPSSRMGAGILDKMRNVFGKR